MNKVTLIGFVGNDPKTASFNDGTKEKASFSLATSEKFGEKIYTTWHKVVAWNQLAKITMKLLKKGSQVAIEGRIVYHEVIHDEFKQYFTEIVADSVRVLDHANTKVSSPVEKITEVLTATVKTFAKKPKTKKVVTPVMEESMPF